MLHVLHNVTTQLLDVISQSSVFYLLFALLIFYQLGNRRIQETPHLRELGQRMGLLSFFAYLVCGYRQHGMPFDAELAEVVFRALLCAGFGTSIGWLLLPVGSLLRKHTIGSAARLFSRRRP